MAISFDTISNFFQGSALGKLAANFSKIANEFPKVIYRDGSTAMSGDLDMNSRRIINHGSPVNDNDLATLAQVKVYTSAITAGPPGPSNNTRATLSQLKAAAISDVSSFYDGSLWTWTLGNYTGLADDVNIVQSNSTALNVGAWVRQTATKLPVNNGPNTIPASVQDSLRWVTQADLAAYGVTSGVPLNVAAGRAAANGARRIHIPKGTMLIDDLVVCNDSNGNGYVFHGEGDSTLINCTATNIGFAIGGSGCQIRDLRINLKAPSYGGVGALFASYNRALVENVVVSMDSGLNCNAYTFVGGGAAVIRDVVFRNCTAINPQRMGAEFLHQGDSGRTAVSGLVIENFKCIGGTSGVTPNFAPAISIDGLFANPKVRGLWHSDSVGTSLELIEANNADVDDLTFVRPRGALVACTTANARPVINPTLSRLRTYEPVEENVLVLTAAQGALVTDSFLPGCHIENGAAINTRISRNFLSSAVVGVIYNGGGGGGGANMTISDNLIDHSPYTGTNGSIMQFDTGAAGSFVANNRLIKSANGIYSRGAVTPISVNNLKDGVLAASGL